MSIVSVEDIKAHANVTIDDDDDLLQAYIDAAEEWVGKFTGKALDSYAADNPPADVPEPLKQAVKMLAAHLYANREATLVGNTLTIVDVSPGIYDLMAPYREYVF
jgi:hypothetical protein